jgi:hypothetical protein
MKLRYRFTQTQNVEICLPSLNGSRRTILKKLSMCGFGLVAAVGRGRVHSAIVALPQIGLILEPRDCVSGS